MPVVQLQAEVSSEQLLQAVAQLPQSEWEAFIAHVLTVRPPHAEQRLSQVESELLLKINQGIPPDRQHRYDELITKRQALTLTSNEQEELLKLSDQIELNDAKRVEYLLELAQIQNKPLTVLMDELGIRTPEYA